MRGDGGRRNWGAMGRNHTQWWKKKVSGWVYDDEVKVKWWLMVKSEDEWWRERQWWVTLINTTNLQVWRVIMVVARCRWGGEWDSQHPSRLYIPTYARLYLHTHIHTYTRIYLPRAHTHMNTHIRTIVLFSPRHIWKHTHVSVKVSTPAYSL